MDLLGRSEPSTLGDSLACLLQLVTVHVFFQLVTQASFADRSEVGVISVFELIHVLLALLLGLLFQLLIEFVLLLF